MSIMKPDALMQLWATPMGVHQLSHGEAVNSTLARVFKSMQLTDPDAGTGAQPFYVILDDLLQRIRLSK
jgi:hypothetical protein